MRIEHVTEAAAVHAAVELFDAPPQAEATAAFLAAAGHHLLLAYDGDVAVGMVTGVELTHPDKGTELFLYELGVSESARGRGVATALVRALADLARARGCYGMWALTEPDNEAALRTYGRGGATRREECVLLEWTALA